MYDIDIEADAYMEEEGITTLRKWLYERKIAHVATPQAGKYNNVFFGQQSNTNWHTHCKFLLKWICFVGCSTTIQQFVSRPLKHCTTHSSGSAYVYQIKLVWWPRCWVCLKLRMSIQCCNLALISLEEIFLVLQSVFKINNYVWCLAAIVKDVFFAAVQSVFFSSTRKTQKWSIYTKVMFLFYTK